MCERVVEEGNPEQAEGIKKCPAGQRGPDGSVSDHMKRSSTPLCITHRLWSNLENVGLNMQ